MASKNIDDIPTAESPTTVVAADEKMKVVVFADWDVLRRDPKSGRIYGNYHGTPAEACKDKAATMSIDRAHITRMMFVENCPGSHGGIWKFDVN